VISDVVPGRLDRFPRERTWLLPALHAVQEALGYLPDWALAQTAAHLRVPPSEVYGVASGYPEFRLTPRGAHHVRVCTGVTCRLLGGAEIAEALDRRYRAVSGPSGLPRAGAAPAPSVTTEAADCLFACSVAPLIEVDGAARGRVQVGDVARVESWFRAAPPDGPAVPARARARASGASATDALARLVAGAQRSDETGHRARLLVQMGTCGRAVGSEGVFAALAEAVARRGLDVALVEGACNGMCYAAPLVEVRAAGWPRVVIERLDAAATGPLLDQVTNGQGDFRAAGLSGIAWTDAPWRGLTPAREHPFWKGQERVLLSRCGAVDPADLDDALRHGAYAALARALDGPPAAVIEAVKAAGLQGRGGAFFPTAVKWEGCRAAAGEPKYVVMNGEEGEPGIFKDRHLMEGDPHQVLEGVLLAAYAVGASSAVLYVHGEAHLSAARLGRAVAETEAAGICGEGMLGRPVACHVLLRRGAGGFVLGEETALLESIEGRRAQPRTRPPFPVESGLYGKPTVINNVETLSAIPAILRGGPAWFAALGTAKAPGTKVFGLSGPIRRPGVVEARNGVTLRDLLEGIGGGPLDRRSLLGAVVGGPSGTIVPAALFDVPMEPRERVSPGTGGIVAVPADGSVIDIVTTLLRFNAAESCGKCTPCREGTPRLLDLIGELRGTREPGEAVERIRSLAETIQLASLCGLGQAAPLALLRALETFPDRFRAT
jgi:NADH:ubiquinone oxidoreductase subunit F (NADH-binding)/NADH:ubiquinone oxidoreductase subunit E